MSSANTAAGTDKIMVAHQKAISHAVFSVTGKRIASFVSIGSAIDSKSFGVEDSQHKAFKAETLDGRFLFVKINTSSDARAKLDREAHGLHSMRRTRSVRVPKVIAVTTLPDGGRAAALILEYVEMTTMSLDEERKFGTKLARMHMDEGSECFGYPLNTWLESTLQVNDWSDDWCDFFSKHRLGQQAEMILEKHGDTELVAKVERLRVGLRERFFDGLKIKPSLLHGNLWSRNWGADNTGRAVVYDPACYFGHNEMELAMLTLFGGPAKGFFVKYHELLPRAEPGYEDRMFLYKLYHYLNLYLQFGRGFRASCIALANLLLGPSVGGGSSAHAEASGDSA